MIVHIYLNRSEHISVNFCAFLGMQPPPKDIKEKQRLIEDNLAELMVKPSMLKEAQGDNVSNDLEWDNDIGSEQSETRRLLSRDRTTTDDEADR